MKIKVLSYKGRSIWKNFFLKKKIFYYKNLNRNVLIRNFLITKFLLKRYKFVFVFHKKGYMRFYLDKAKLGFKIGQFLFNKLYGFKMHVLKKKRKKR